MLFVLEAADRQPSSASERIWRHLWELRDTVSVNVVLPTVVASPCPLLAEEQAETVCSMTGMQVPAGSAWIPLKVDLARYVKSDGDIRTQALERALTRCVDSGDSLHETGHWRAPLLQYDSWLNRRLAIAIRGWGTVVKRRRADPCSFATLEALEELAAFITATLVTHSRSLARQRGHCPALEVAGARLAGSGAEMKARWRRAVAESALRHRNLTMMSPWDVFPAGEPADRRYLDLLPVLRRADCLSFRRDVDIRHWKVNEYRGFYERVAAILERRNATGVIAKHV